MIISHRYRYLFVELPRTGSTAIHRELRRMYDGEPILYKHATYPEFLTVASEDEKRYFVFSTIRNPLDQTVSRYFKVKTDHKQQFSDRERAKGKRLVNRIVDDRIFSFLRKTNADFITYFRRFQLLPYDTWASLSHREFNYVLRFESLGDDFDRVLRMIGIEPKRPLPVTNPTAARERDFEDYYPPATRAQARRVYGPYMERWGYRFPESWGIDGPTRLDRATYNVYSFLCCLYWRHVRHRIGGSGKHADPDRSGRLPAATGSGSTGRPPPAAAPLGSAGPVVLPPRNPLRKRLAHTRAHQVWRYGQALIGARANRGMMRDVETFCLFLGHGRSGHSIIGALLDAHPDIILADELDVLGYLEAGFSREQVLYLALKTARDQVKRQRLKRGRGGIAYSYFVPGQWQGRVRRAKVIGASKAGESVHRLAARPELAARLAETMHGLDLRFIHVIRNPYDNLATMMLRRGRTFDAAFTQYFDDWEALVKLRQLLGEQRICTTAHEAMVADPRGELAKLCRFLGVEPDAGYLEACASILYQSPSKSRHAVTWTESQLSLVAERIAQVELLQPYSFED